MLADVGVQAQTFCGQEFHPFHVVGTGVYIVVYVGPSLALKPNLDFGSADFVRCNARIARKVSIDFLHKILCDPKSAMQGFGLNKFPFT